MRVAILSRNPKLDSTRRLVEVGTALGHQVDVIIPCTVIWISPVADLLSGMMVNYAPITMLLFHV
jgi:hypothetical protein